MADPEGRAAAALPRSVRGADGAAITSLVLVLLALRIAFVAARVIHGPVADETLRRLTTIATSPGLPYRDFAVEYGPLDTLMISLLASSGYPALWDRIHVVAMCADIATWFVIARRWGSRAGATYLLLGLPLVWLCYARLDLMSVMLATLGVAWVDQAHDRRGGLTVAAAALSKLWPVVILPIMWETGSRRAVLWTISAVSIGALVWMATTTPSALLQVVTYRGATGWSVESTVGTIVWTTTDSDLRMEEGSQRVGLMAPWERTILAAILGVTLIGIALKVRHKTSGFIGGASLAAVAALLTCSPLSSLQYACWLLPWAAVGWTEPLARSQRNATITVVASTSALGFLTTVGAPLALVKVLLLTRAAGTIATVVTWAGWRRRLPSPEVLPPVATN